MHSDHLLLINLKFQGREPWLKKSR